MSLRTRSSIWTFLSQELFTILSVVVGLVSTPLILRWLGDERFGAFETVTDWAGYIALLEFGVGEAIQALLGRSFGVRDRESIRKILVESLRVYGRSALVMLAVGAAVTPFITRLIPVGPNNASDLQTAWLIGLCGSVLLPFSAFRILAQVEQRGYRVNTLVIGNWFIVTTLSLLFAWAGWGITGQAVAVLLGTIFFNLVLSIEELREFPAIFKAVLMDPIDSKVRAGISDLRWPGLVFNLCGRFSFLTDNIVVALVMSPAMVVPFFVTQRLSSLGARELQAVGGASWAALTELHNQGKREIFNARLLELTHLVAILAMAGLLPIIAYNRYFVERWVGGTRYGGDLLTIVAAVNALLLAIFSLWAWVVNSTGHVRDILPGTLAQTIVNVLASVFFTFEFGIVGPVLGTLVAFLSIGAWYVPLVMARIFQSKPSELAVALLQPIALGIPYEILLRAFSRTYGAPEWFAIAWQVAAAGLGYLAIASVILLSKSERAQWMERVRLVTRSSAT
jgi:O-antigen/teichoic acid export membrane protein